MADVLQIPTAPTPQRYSIQLAGTFYRLSFVWNVEMNCWVLDISDQNDDPLICGIPLITGADLLAQYAYIGIGGQMIVQSDANPDAVPTYLNLGTIGHLYFIPNEVVA